MKNPPLSKRYLVVRIAKLEREAMRIHADWFHHLRSNALLMERIEKIEEAINLIDMKKLISEATQQDDHNGPDPLIESNTASSDGDKLAAAVWYLGHSIDLLARDVGGEEE